MVKRTKKILALCLALTMLIACMVFDVGATSTQYFTFTGPTTTTRGATVSLSIQMSDVKLLMGVQGTVNFDASALTLDTAVDEHDHYYSITGPGSDSFNYVWTADIDNTAGKVNFLAANEAPFSDTETATPVVMVLNFKVKDTAANGDYAFTYSNCTAAKASGVYESLGTSGAFTVTVGEPLPPVTVDDIHNTIVGLDLGTMEYAISTDGGNTYGAYSSNALTMKYATLGITTLTGSKMVKVRAKATAGPDAILTFTPDFGDVNGDGNITITDATRILRIASGAVTPSDSEKLRANVSSKTDATVSITDALMVLKRASGVQVSWAVEQ